MKITKSQLKQIIKEVLNEMHQQPLAVAGGPHQKLQGYTYDRLNGVHVLDTYNPRSDYGGELDKAIAQVHAQEEEPLRMGAPKEDPWKLKKRLGVGGSVHDRLGGPRHREKK